MIIGNKSFYIVFFILFLLSGCFMNKEPKFAVSGDKEILDKLIINIKTISSASRNIYEVQTLLYKGEIFLLELDDPEVIRYEMFASLNGELIGRSVEYDNIMRFYRRDQINNIEVHEAGDGSIKIFHIMSKDDLLNDKKRSATISFKVNQIFDDFIQEQEISKDNWEYIFYKDAFFKKF